jgi:hypothetical protein
VCCLGGGDQSGDRGEVEVRAGQLSISTLASLGNPEERGSLWGWSQAVFLDRGM